jgi:ribosomal protein L37E
MPQRTREQVARLANEFLQNHFRAIASRRLNDGLVSYGATNHLRLDCAETCHRCGARLINHQPCNYCPHCGADVRPYSVEMECGEELLDAHNQCGIAQRRGDWPAWKVCGVAKLCGIALAVLDAGTEERVKQYLAMLRVVPSAASLPGADEEEV